MKKIISLITLSVSLAVSVFSQTADEIIEKHLTAIGGKEKLMLLNTSVSEGNLSVQGMDIPIKISQVHGKAQRVEITVMGMTGYIIITSTNGWTYLPFQGQAAPEAMPAEAFEVEAQLLHDGL